MSGESVGPIHQLAYTVDEAEAMELISLAVQRGASPDEAHDAWVIWLQIRREDVTTLQSGADGNEHLCLCSHIHARGRCWSRSCGCMSLRSTRAAAV